MSNKGTIRLTKVVETQYGEQSVIDSPFEARFWVKVLPWQDGEPSLERIDPEEEYAAEAVEAAKEHDFGASEVRPSWDPQESSWQIRNDEADAAIEFWEKNGWSVEDER